MQHVATMKVITILCTLFSLIFIASAGRWSDWQAFGPCTSVQQPGDKVLKALDIQRGTQTRSRFCLEDDNEYETDEDEQPLENCQVGEKETEDRACRIPTVWSKFSAPGKCSAKCGHGKRIMKRQCILNTGAIPVEEAKDMCPLGEVQFVNQTCIKRPCAVNGGWSEWSDWGPCGSAECDFPAQTNIQGLQYKIRTCSKPVPNHGGKMCEGPFIEIGTCFGPTNCPIDGGWGNWTAWSPWNCKDERRNKTRVCDNPPPRNGGKKCDGGAGIEFFDKLKNLDSFNKACGTVPAEDSDKDTTPAPFDDYDNDNDYDNGNDNDNDNDNDVNEEFDDDKDKDD